jgi:hypothetical protein
MCAQDAAVVVEVADRVNDVSTWVGHRPSTASEWWSADRDRPDQDRPIGVGGVRRVDPSTVGGQVLPDRCGGGEVRRDQVQDMERPSSGGAVRHQLTHAQVFRMSRQTAQPATMDNRAQTQIDQASPNNSCYSPPGIPEP